MSLRRRTVILGFLRERANGSSRYEGDLADVRARVGPRAGLDALRVLPRIPRALPPDTSPELVSGQPAEGQDQPHIRILPAGEAAAISVVAPPGTPLLDAYRAARDFALANPANPFLSFEPVPLAEEALAALDAARETAARSPAGGVDSAPVGSRTLDQAPPGPRPDQVRTPGGAE